MLGFLLALGFLLVVLGFVVLLGFLLALMSGGGGSRLTRSGTGGTRLGTARRARRRCRWLMVAKG